LPDKVIDIIDEAGARLHIQNSTLMPEQAELEKKLEEAKQQKQQALNARDYSQASQFKNEEERVRKELESRLEEWNKQNLANRVPVTLEDIRKVVSQASGVPLTRMEEGESARLLRMEQELEKVVVGQDSAVKSISRALRRSRAELKDPRRPIGTFLFLGPSGVGKTLLAKALSEFMFGNQDALIRFDMSEYMEKHEVSRMIGAAPGYVGFDNGGQLTEAVRRKPYSVVLFDEIEKAHPDVSNILLQIMEEGQLTDNIGTTVSFRNTIIVMTSNLGAEKLSKPLSLGFGAGTNAENAADQEKLKEVLNDAAKKFFKPEFINRLDEVVIFQRLSHESLVKVLDLEVAKIASRITAKEGVLVIPPEVKEFILKFATEGDFGARLIRRYVEHYIEDPLAEAILLYGKTGAFTATASVDENEKQVRFQVEPIPAPKPAKKAAK
ncbi:MAG: ATP-dependent Clp protease ATP-binding subunit, partial [Victivallales bacterium]|nr:ATP-dependent Clp protease ATP-binding subunit [Victivallales bacterium]